MKIHRIISKKQDNGIWGTPLKLQKMVMNGGFPLFDKQLLISAIVIKFSELYDVNFRCDIRERTMSLYHEGNRDICGNSYIITYDDYRIVDDKLFYLETDHDKLEFSRMMKLKNIKNRINVDS